MLAQLPGGISLYYEIAGEGVPLLLINGYCNHHLAWGPIVSSLAEHFKVITFDNRGAGQTTGWTSSFSIADMAKDALLLLDHLHIHKAHMVGHSMGGCILEQIALTSPERIEKGVLYASTPYCTTVQQKQIEGAAHLFRAGVPREVVFKSALPLLFGSPFLKRHYDTALHFFLDDPFPMTPDGMLSQMGAFFPFDVRERLGEIKTPFLVMTGEEDISAPRYLSDLLVKGIPGAKEKMIPEVGHTIHLENPTLFLKTLLTFLHES